MVDSAFDVYQPRGHRQNSLGPATGGAAGQRMEREYELRECMRNPEFRKMFVPAQNWLCVKKQPNVLRELLTR